MEVFMEIGNPNIPTHNVLRKNDNIKNLILIGMGLMLGIIIFQLIKLNYEEQNPNKTFS
jgi:hypothetical protein